MLIATRALLFSDGGCCRALHTIRGRLPAKDERCREGPYVPAQLPEAGLARASVEPGPTEYKASAKQQSTGTITDATDRL